VQHVGILRKFNQERSNERSAGQNEGFRRLFPGQAFGFLQAVRTASGLGKFQMEAGVRFDHLKKLPSAFLESGPENFMTLHDLLERLLENSAVQRTIEAEADRHVERRDARAQVVQVPEGLLCRRGGERDLFSAGWR